MKIMSLFDGIACGRIALDRINAKVDKYYASEVDKYAMKIAQKNYPDIIQLGDVNDINFNDYVGKIDLLMAGSPCQGFSKAGKGLNFDDSRSKLFFKFVESLRIIKPKYFLLENVDMKKEWQDIITEYLKVKLIKINSALVSAQSRERCYWTNIPGVKQPEDKKIFLKDIVLSDELIKNNNQVLEDAMNICFDNLYRTKREARIYEGKSPTIRANRSGLELINIENLIHSQKALDYMNRQVADGRTHWDFKHHSDIHNDKSATVVANFFKGVPYNVFKDWDCIRKFHPIECERLQTIPDNYTEGVSNTQRYKAIGNAWTVDVIAHILSEVKI